MGLMTINIYEIMLIGVALAMDAFGVAIGVGLSERKNRFSDKAYILSFGFFQFLLSFLGGVLGYFFNTYIVSVPKIIGGIVIAIVGILMIIEGTAKTSKPVLLKKIMIIILGISVSIDAFVVGFTVLNQFYSFYLLFLYCLIIGLIALLISTIGFFLCLYFSKVGFFIKYSNYLGGIVLILFGVKMIFI